MFGLNLGYKSTPIQAYDARGNIVWECELDIYGKVRNLHGEKTFIPFRYQGQYEDIETGLYYNRFRYYSPDTGTYISKDPIGLAGDMPNMYSYVEDSNSWLDPLGLTKFNPIEVLGRKVYQNGTDFITGTPDFVHSSVHPSIVNRIKNGATNLDLMKAGNAPIGTDGKYINLHHVLGKEPGPMVELSETIHKKYHKQLHGLIEDGRSFRHNKLLKRSYTNFRKNYWKSRAAQIEADMKAKSKPKINCH
ncbi:HNH/ENDO VII family nuclease [Tenacibaculum maritimum]|uniref:HNH/ENDO VII family nuclease n=1 Tax=Tenacibaculum maritimum TaxID=107401 RepID=UPI003876A960